MSIDTEMTTNAVCPYCGYVERDSWEIDVGGTEGDTEIACGSCSEEYQVFREVTVTYTTRKLP